MEENQGASFMESPTRHLDDVLYEKLESAFEEQPPEMTHQLSRIAIEHSPVDLAIAANKFSPQSRSLIYLQLPDLEDRAEFLIQADSTTRIHLFRSIRNKELKELVEKMPTDDAVDVIEDLSPWRMIHLFEILDPQKAELIKELLKHEQNTAGRLMTNEFFAFNMETTIAEAASTIRENPDIVFTRRIFVLNDAGKLQGYVPSRNLIVNPPHLPLKQVMRPVLHTVSPEASREEVVDLVERYKISALPVVIGQNYLVGVITYEDVVEALEDITDDTVAMIAGTEEKITSYQPWSRRFFGRAPWLLATMAAGLVNMEVMSFFEKRVGAVLTFLLFFVPLINALSGNIGLQCSTVLVRGMAVGLVSQSNKWSMSLKEISLGIFTGVVFGLLCGGIIYFLHHIGFQHLNVDPLAIALIIGSGLTGACIVGSVLGATAPLFFVRMGIDPAVASGPIVTAFNDVLAMSFYFMVVTTLSRVLLL